MHYVTATVVDLIAGGNPPTAEVRLTEADGTVAVIHDKQPVLGADRLGPVELQCDVVGEDSDGSVHIRLRHHVEDQHGRGTFRVAAGAVRPEGPGELLGRLLREHGVDPDAVRDVEAAWQGFTAFAQTQIDGLNPDGDADGLIVQWGPSNLSFTRQLAFPGDDDPALSRVSLDMVFSGFGDLPSGHSGWEFDPPGPRRATALTALRASVPSGYDLWNATPVHSTIEDDLTD